MKKLRVGILGATGMVGQSYVSLLNSHPWFEVSHVVASKSSSGKKYLDSVAGRWHMKDDVPKNAGSLMVAAVEDIDLSLKNCDFVFSALDSQIAKEWEEKYAKAGIPVV